MAYSEAENFVNCLVRNVHARDLDTFNPYRDRCLVYDQLTGPQIRCDLLQSLVDSAIGRGVKDLWVGSCPGWRGARRTGLAFTDDLHVQEHATRRGQARMLRYGRPTRSKPIAEASATAVWRLLRQIDTRIFLWNAFPFHPHEPGQQFTNRGLIRPEREFGREILGALIDLLQPYRLVAIGKDAYEALRILNLGPHTVRVRHPSHGGVREFTRGIAEIYGLEMADPGQRQRGLFEEAIKSVSDHRKEV